MNAETVVYEVGPEYGQIRDRGVSFVKWYPEPSILAACAFPSAGLVGHRLWLIEQGGEGEEVVEPDVVEHDPGAGLMWLGDVYSLVSRDEPDSAIDVLFAHIDDLLSAGAFERCNAVLKTIDHMRLDTNLLIATLSSTKRAAAYLPARDDFVRRTRARLNELAPERAERLLDGLT